MIPLSDTKSTGKFPFWIVVIIAINIFVFYLELTSPNPDAFIAKYALIPANIDLNNFKTLTPFITSQFLHAGFLHIISNMLFLWVFGDNVEDRFGFFFFPIFYLLSGAVGGFLQYIFAPTSTIPMLGASGAIAGVLGAYLTLFPDHQVKTLVPIFGFITIVNIPASVMLIYWFITQLFHGAYSITTSLTKLGGVAYFAHIGGFITGIIVARFFKSSSPQRLEAI